MAGLCLLFSSLSYCRPFKTISSLGIVPSSARYPKRAYQNSPSSAPTILIGHHNVADDHGKESGKSDGVLLCQLSRKSEVRRPTVLAVAECDGHWERMVVKDSAVRAEFCLEAVEWFAGEVSRLSLSRSSLRSPGTCIYPQGDGGQVFNVT